MKTLVEEGTSAHFASSGNAVKVLKHQLRNINTLTPLVFIMISSLSRILTKLTICNYFVDINCAEE